MANIYKINQGVRISITFTVEGAATDPDTVTLKVKDPLGNEVIYTYSGDITRSAKGAYYKDVVVDSPGYWHYRWEGTGSCIAADEDTFFVRNSEFTEDESA
jgi:hypothetical protein